MRPNNTHRIVPLNDMPDGTCRTIKAQYNNSSVANFVRHDAFAATGGGRSMRQIRNIYYGWSRNAKGEIDNWHKSLISNSITTFCGGGWNTSPKVAVVYETL